MPVNPPQLDRPFKIFISSSQSEFEEFRQGLKADIDDERWSALRPMRAILIENQRGPVIHQEIRRELDGCSIYVGIFGQVWSEWTAAEFKYARSIDIPLMVYQVSERARRHAGRSSRVETFLQKEVKQLGIKVLGPYRIERLAGDIITNLAIQVADMVTEAASIRKLTHPGIIR